VSVRPFVRPPHVGTVPKRLNVVSRKQRLTIAHGLYFYDAYDLYEILLGTHPTGAPNADEYCETPMLCVHPLFAI